MGKQWKQCQTLFWGGSKITADGDCSHEIKRRLLLGRKVMTNLDSTFKSRDIALFTKVHLVKAMVFTVVMYGYESWTVNKAERQRMFILPHNYTHFTHQHIKSRDITLPTEFHIVKIMVFPVVMYGCGTEP